VLAAGSGTRIWPYNEVRNTCALPVGGVPNVLVVDALAQVGVRSLSSGTMPDRSAQRSWALRYRSPMSSSPAELARPTPYSPVFA
jgi:hypothetical protein